MKRLVPVTVFMAIITMSSVTAKSVVFTVSAPEDALYEMR